MPCKMIALALLLALLPIMAHAQDPGLVNPDTTFATAPVAAAPTPADVSAFGNVLASGNNVTDVAGQYGVFAATWNATALPISAGIEAMVTALSGLANSWFPPWVGAYMLIMMMMAAWRGDQGAFLITLRMAFLASIVWGIAAHPETYDAWVVQPVNGVIFGISKALANIFNGAGNGQAVTASMFDAMWLKMMAFGAKAFAIFPWYSPKGIVLSAVAILFDAVTTIAIGLMFGLWLLAWITTKFTLAFGPMFVPLLFFGPATKWLFQGWLRALVGAMLQQIVSIAVLSLFSVVLVNVMGSALKVSTAGEGDIAGTVAILCFGMMAAGLITFLLWTLMKLALQIAGAGSMAVSSWREVGAVVPMPQLSAPSHSPMISGPSGVGSGAGARPRQYAFQRSGG